MTRISFIIVLLGMLYAGGAIAAVNVNTADADQLKELTGVGSVKAEAIVQDRETHGKYESLDDLTRVDGIGSKTVEGLQDQASVGSDDMSSTSTEADNAGDM